ncbi:DUF4299 family protein [Campylobacter sp. FOBRC14]|uniref:DUF4299 family protein n=1 Tax=Campylobacter sp. FOBRC14 TaxID=936554 RepID=UPI00027A378B|nr:DUF4299 family protein [Campylobacter sp. FOBRC14]EJP75914.1 PF14132 domain protein [Campylobacter sp. FOBRC14]
MSVVFSIKNKKKLLGYASVLSVEEALGLAPNLAQFSFDEDEKGFNAQAFYSSKIPYEGCIVIGVKGVSGRGFELNYNEGEKSYEVRVLTPSARTDWQIALEFMSNLAARLGSPIVADTDEQSYDSQAILKFDYERDIMFELQATKNDFEKNKTDTYINYGITRPFVMNLAMIDEILADADPVGKYSQMLVSTQHLDAYAAHQQFFENEAGEILGLYVLSQGLDTLLPFEPYIEYENLEILGDRKVAKWQLSLVAVDGDDQNEESYKPFADVPYKKFMANLPQDKYRFIDATYIEIKGLSKQEMEQIAAKCE